LSSTPRLQFHSRQDCITTSSNAPLVGISPWMEEINPYSETGTGSVP
jgi:hypothetical protein